MTFDLHSLQESLRAVLPGFAWTLVISAVAIVASTVFGVGLCFVRVGIGGIPGKAVAIATGALRAMPELSLIFLLYFGFPSVWEIRLGAVICGTLALSVIGAAHAAEIARAGLLALPKGQVHAARALGFGIVGTWRRILWPQLSRKVIPPYLNLITELIKSTSLLAALGVSEITGRANAYGGASFRYLEAFTIVAALFILIITPVSILSRRWERAASR